MKGISKAGQSLPLARASALMWHMDFCNKNQGDRLLNKVFVARPVLALRIHSSASGRSRHGE
jgi:hypothetical protein